MCNQKTNVNIVKVRDDNQPVELLKVSEEDGSISFKLKSGCNANWINEKCSVMELRNRVEPWLTALFQSEHLSVLIGSGLTTAVQMKACGSGNNGMSSYSPQSVYKNEIMTYAKRSAISAGRGDQPNLEDYIRTMNELYQGLKVLDCNAEAKELREELCDVLRSFTENISEIENSIATADPSKKEEAFNQLVTFLMSFASRTGTRDRLNLFTTNYDRLIEAAADLAGVHLIDRFVGALSPVFRSSRLDIDMYYNPLGVRGEPRYLEGVVRYTKLHGSIDWINTNQHIRKIGLPFGAKKIEPYLDAPGLNVDSTKIMIYPNASKDRETTEYPYVELFRDFAAALCRPNSTLVTYGYSFGDDHINRVIRDMLTIPSTHLVVIAYDDSLGRIKKLYKEWGRQNQISLLIGADIANMDALVDYYLPKPAIDKTTLRMAELLRQRYDVPSATREKGESEDDNASF